jgi:hypothetical protein
MPSQCSSAAFRVISSQRLHNGTPNSARAARLFCHSPTRRILGLCRPSPSRRCFPGDPCWPSADELDRLNASLVGNLVSTNPIGSVCPKTTHFTPYNCQKCSELRSHWPIPAIHYEDPTSPMAAWWANFSCSPFSPASDLCTIDLLAHYTANVTSAADVQKVIEFTTRHNIRLAIRNTGHDYLGRSTAPAPSRFGCTTLNSPSTGQSTLPLGIPAQPCGSALAFKATKLKMPLTEQDPVMSSCLDTLPTSASQEDTHRVVGMARWHRNTALRLTRFSSGRLLRRQARFLLHPRSRMQISTGRLVVEAEEPIQLP